MENIVEFCRAWKTIPRITKIQPKRPICDFVFWCLGNKLDFRALLSEIYIKIEVFSSLEHNYTGAPIAQLAACLTFFIWFWPDLTREGVGSIPLEENDFFFFVQIRYSNFFMYASMTYNNKQESKVVGYLLLITLNFWTVCEGKSDQSNFFAWFGMLKIPTLVHQSPMRQIQRWIKEMETWEIPSLFTSKW